MSDYGKMPEILKSRTMEKEREESRRELEQKKKQIEEVSASVRLVSISTFCLVARDYRKNFMSLSLHTTLRFVLTRNIMLSFFSCLFSCFLFPCLQMIDFKLLSKTATRIQ